MTRPDGRGASDRSERRVLTGSSAQVDPHVLAEMETLNKWVEATQGWDLDPQILLITPTARAMVIIPALTWRKVDHHPVPIMQALAREAAQVRAQMGLTDPILAAVLICETWVFDYDAADKRKARELRDVTRRRLVHLHPDRLEARHIAAVDAWGRSCTLLYFRERQSVLIEHNLNDGGLRQGLSAICPAFNEGMTVPEQPGGDAGSDVTADQAGQEAAGAAHQKDT